MIIRQTCHSNKISQPNKSPEECDICVCMCLCAWVCGGGKGGGGGVDNAEVWYKVFASTDRKLIT